MKTFQIITDSSCDLPQELADKLELLVLPLHFTIGGKTYANYLDGREIGFHDFFERIRQGEAASTSAVNRESFREVMEQTLQQGLDILFVGFSSGLSTTYQSGCIAADDLREKYPERKILTVDSLCASLGQGLYVYLGALQQQAGKSIEEVRDYLEDIKLHLCHWFTVDDLMYLKRGGRISATTAVLGTVMQIKPVMHMDNDGHLANVTKARGRKGSLIALAEKALTTSTDLPSQTMFICHGDCYDDAKFVADYIRERSKQQDSCHAQPAEHSVEHIVQHQRHAEVADQCENRRDQHVRMERTDNDQHHCHQSADRAQIHPRGHGKHMRGRKLGGARGHAHQRERQKCRLDVVNERALRSAEALPCLDIHHFVDGVEKAVDKGGNIINQHVISSCVYYVPSTTSATPAASST